MGLFSKKKEANKDTISGFQSIRCIIVLEIVGRPADYIRKAMSLVIKGLSKEEGVKIISRKTHKIKKVQTLFSTFSEIEMSVNSLPKLISIIFGYTPSSIEIIEPMSLELNINDANNLLNDFASKIHKAEAVAKRLGIENEILKKHIGEIGK